MIAGGGDADQNVPPTNSDGDWRGACTLGQGPAHFDRNADGLGCGAGDS